MTRKFYHLMGTLDSLLRYLGTTALNPATVACAGTFPVPTANPDQAYKNVECIRRAIQSKAQALSTALDNIIDAREEVFTLAQDAYNAGGASTFEYEDVLDAMSGTRVRRRTFPQMSFMDIAWALTEKQGAPAAFKDWIKAFRKNALPAFHFVDGLAKAAAANAELIAVAVARGQDLLDALEVLNPGPGDGIGPVHNLDPTLRLELSRVQAELERLIAGGGGGPDDGWPRIYTSSSSSSSSSSS